MGREVGLPPGVLNIVTGSGSTTGQAIVDHPGIDKIAFTGDTSTGRGIMRSAAGSLKHITLELGGKSPNIVFPDADLEAAVRGATMGIFYGKGEVCAAGSRLLVDRSIRRRGSVRSHRKRSSIACSGTSKSPGARARRSRPAEARQTLARARATSC